MCIVVTKKTKRNISGNVFSQSGMEIIRTYPIRVTLYCKTVAMFKTKNVKYILQKYGSTKHGKFCQTYLQKCSKSLICFILKIFARFNKQFFFLYLVKSSVN